MSDEDRRRSCDGKTPYSTFEKAVAASKRRRRRKRHIAMKTRRDIYRCRHCRFFHLGGSFQ